MGEHRIAWALHNYELEQTIIRLRNSRNRLLDKYDNETIRSMCAFIRIKQLEIENSKLQSLNSELSNIIAAP